MYGVRAKTLPAKIGSVLEILIFKGKRVNFGSGSASVLKDENFPKLKRSRSARNAKHPRFYSYTIFFFDQIALLIPNVAVIGVVLAYPTLITSIGSLFFLPLAAASALILALMAKFLPETKGRAVDDIFRTLADSRTNSMTDYGAIGGTETAVELKRILP